MDKQHIKDFIFRYHKQIDNDDTLKDDDFNTDNFFNVGNTVTNEWIETDNVDDHILKNHLEMLVDQVATDKEFYIFDALIHGRSYKDISQVLECSTESVRQWFDKLIDKIMEVIE
ncbi:pathogenicity island protein [Staphylococcus pseudintermedius]|uniref:pathogenicity island protein n=1 Tax=Staphylococcus pseudintermedius TaxID=283734 RepID=UPI0018E1D55F|nr:pathogenicity island protein [Staphylococcus pseudintermedius]EGQ0396965.1 pathogenicity island protein [Staphylococcus pseudintermedius]EGQ1309626.1 pathogenicity island protein [Staphylococcus pseudintermedius]EGQ2713593.1 pathogenicity island protein [Staphylococcus pseudintermedius]EGQ3437695.1 pathogenicity island protein [Staphylococcus pseudintermedius]EGQ4038938.1 pathogenicity island protein [Staphylococcus pseudintermedius]